MDAARFLTTLGQSLAALSLYGPGHPAFRRAVSLAADRFAELQASEVRMQLTFLPHEVLAGQEVLHELHEWEWGARLRAVGIERVEFMGIVSSDELERFVDHLGARLGCRPTDSSEVWQLGHGNIRWGRLELPGGADSAPARPEALPLATLAFSLREERDAVSWLHGEVEAGTTLPLVEAEAVVRSLSLAMHADQAMVLPLLELKEYDQYTTTHSMNVAVLSMALAEHLELDGDTLRSVGLAALLHDLGKVRIPREILMKPGTLSEQEREVVRRHPADGARMILERQDELDLAATVAYEHHLMIDGGGYPCLHYPRAAAYASRLVHVCDVYDALRTRRPYRDAWESEPTLAYIQSRAGLEFDPAIAGAFVRMMRQWEARVLAVSES
jgi:putative nucleotidyltransferase with HDIG domain